MLHYIVNHPLYLHTMIFEFRQENCFYEFENAHLLIRLYKQNHQTLVDVITVICPIIQSHQQREKARDEACQVCQYH